MRKAFTIAIVICSILQLAAGGITLVSYFILLPKYQELEWYSQHRVDQVVAVLRNGEPLTPAQREAIIRHVENDRQMLGIALNLSIGVVEDLVYAGLLYLSVPVLLCVRYFVQRQPKGKVEEQSASEE